mgnify:CR=1 FL=1
MPIRKLKNTELSYHLICYDEEGRERSGDPDGQLSKLALDALTTEPITDVFLISHGWLGDIPDAITQYDKWIGAMAGNTADIERMRQARPGFRPLLIGLHWPSKPYGEEDISQSASFAAPAAGGTSPIDEMIDQYAKTLADTPAARQALQTIFAAAIDDVAPDKMSAEVVEAYQVLDRESNLGSGDVAGDPGSDREPFDPESAFLFAKDEAASFGGFGLGALLAPLRTMSFWKMKDRAAKFGASGAFQLLHRLQGATSDNVRFHLMGHSFGCVVMSATLAGPQTNNALVRPIDSVVLLQGALSLWSYTSNIPHAPGKAGYFRRIFSEQRVSGPFVTTQSEHDTAVGTMYPLAAGASRQVSFAPGKLPKYGALGTFGVRGPDPETVDMAMLPADQPYNFLPGGIYNLESSRYICKMESRTSGAHSDLAHPEVAHAVWEAAMSGL